MVDVFASLSGEQYVREFPDTLARAEKIERVVVDESRHCLIHILQMHRIPRTEKLRIIQNDRSEIFEQLEQFQREHIVGFQKSLYGLLEELGEKRLVGSVFVEGMTAEGVVSLQEGYAKMLQVGTTNRLLQAAIDQGHVQQDEVESVRALIQNGTALIDREVEEMRAQIALNGCLRMFFEKKLRVLPGEDAVLNTQIIQLIDEDVSSLPDACSSIERKRAKEVLHEAREDFVLTQASRLSEYNTAVVFGGDHDWKPNVQTWNEQHLTDTFSLIEVTPAGYSDACERLGELRTALVRDLLTTLSVIHRLEPVMQLDE